MPMTMLGLLARGLLTALGCMLIAQAPGCGTDAEGIDECRDIENARCQAGQYCEDFAIDDVDACKRFYRDQCLHGMASGSKPGKPTVDKCVNAIKAAGECARLKLTSATDCPGVGATLSATPCDVILEPEKTDACDFLFEDLDIPDAAPETSLETGPETGDDAGSDAATD